MNDLDPALEAVIAAVPGWAGERPTEVAPIEAGITNRNFKVTIGGEAFVVRLSGKDTGLLGIDRRAEFEAARAAAGAGVAPEVFAFLPEHAALVTRFVEGFPIPEEDLQREDVLERVVAAIRTLHRGPEIPSSFSPFRVVEDYRVVAMARGVSIPGVYDDLHIRARDMERAFRASPLPLHPCHNDLLNANFIRDGEHVWVVDYEHAGMGDLFFDLGNLSINNGLSEQAQETLLRLYFGAPTDAHRARHKLMRIMSDFREAMWGVVQQGISELDFDYVDYADRHFRRCLASTEDERYPACLVAAAGGS